MDLSKEVFVVMILYGLVERSICCNDETKTKIDEHDEDNAYLRNL